MAVGLDPVPWSKWLGITFSVGTLLGVARFCGRTQGLHCDESGLATLFVPDAVSGLCPGTAVSLSKRDVKVRERTW